MNLNNITFETGFNSKIEYSFEPIKLYDKTSIDGTTRHIKYKFIDGVLQFEEVFTFNIVSVSANDEIALLAIDGSNSVYFQAYDSQTTYICNCSLNHYYYVEQGQEVRAFNVVLKVVGLPQVPSGYIAYYKMADNAANTTVSDETGSYDGVATRNTSLMSATGIQGTANTALKFDRASLDIVTAMLNVGAETELSYSFWVYNTDPQEIGRIVMYGDSGSSKFSDACRLAGAGTVGNGKVEFACDDTFSPNKTLNNTLPLMDVGAWNHFVVSVKNNDFMKMYLNGVKVTAETAIGTRISNGDRIRLGGFAGDGGPQFYLNTKLAEFIIYDRVLTQTEVDTIYALQKP